METKQSLSKLAARLRVLNSLEKQSYLTELDEHTKDHYIQMNSGQLANPFSLQSLAYSMYYALEGTPYTQPEFACEIKLKDIVARKKFNTIFSGVVAYSRASAKEREKFKKSVLGIPNPLAKLSHLIRIRQNGLA